MNKKKNSKSKSSGHSQQHAYRGVRDIILNDSRGTTVSTLTTTASGSATINGAVLPSFLTVPQSVAGGTAGTKDTVLLARLNWFSSTAKNFQSFRITRATLIFVSNVGSTSSGTVNMFASRDYMDIVSPLQTAYVAGKDTKSFDLASASFKEQRMQVPVDPAWKKVTSVLSVLGNDGFNGTQYSIVPVNSINDLIAFGFSIQVVGAPASTNVGNAFIEYDVEFRDPVVLALNA